MKRLRLFVLVLAVLPALALAAPPRLVVTLSVDQMRADYLPRLLPHLPEGGLKRLVEQGAWFTDAHYEYCATFTGPGHAVQSTGTYGYRNGYTNNGYFDRRAGEVVGPASDPEARLVGAEGAGSSPRRLLAGTVGDRLRLATGGRAKVLAISLKDRASVPLAGRLGQAYWYDSSTGRWVTSDYYRKTLPKWVEEANARRIPDQAFGQTWDRRGPEAAYATAHADDVPWEEDAYGLGRAFPHVIKGEAGKRDKTFYKAWRLTPYAIQAQLDLVKDAMAAEALGADDVPDLLFYGLTTTDYVGHAYGPHSHEILSIMFDVDEAVRDLLAHLDETVGAGRYAVVLTADHGVSPVPEYSASMGLSAGRLSAKAILAAIDGALDEQFGKANWIAGYKPPFIAFDHAVVAKKRLALSDVEEVAAASLSGMEGIDSAWGRTRVLRGASPASQLTRRIARCMHPERSGDLYVLVEPYWLWSSYDLHPAGTAHGTPYSYDTHVPLVLFGQGVQAGTFRQPVELADLAPTLAALLGSPPPDRSEGRILHEGLTD